MEKNCTACGGNGFFYAECCSRCNQIWPIGQCHVCIGTGAEKFPDKVMENIKMIREACEPHGYLCGYDPTAD